MVASQTDMGYTQRIVAFIDVLGFGSLVTESGKNQSSEVAAIERISDAILSSIEELEEILGRKSDLRFTQFSDSFVISVDADNSHPLKLEFFTLSVLVVVDCFLRSNLLLRGGVTRGQLIHNETLLFGPAMNRAYELESRLAKFPRIIIDPQLSELTSKILLGNLRRDNDDIFYLDYFAPQKRFFLVPSWWHSIQLVIESMPNSSELQEKRAWLVEKYNHAILRFSYDQFKSQLDDYVDDTDSNNEVVKDYDMLLEYAKQLHML